MPYSANLSLPPSWPFHQPAAAALTPAHYREALHLADSLANLADPRRSAAASPEQVLNVQTSQVCLRTAAVLFSEAVCFKGCVGKTPLLSKALRVRTSWAA